MSKQHTNYRKARINQRQIEVSVVYWLSHPPNTRKVPGAIPGGNIQYFDFFCFSKIFRNEFLFSFKRTKF